MGGSVELVKVVVWSRLNYFGTVIKGTEAVHVAGQAALKITQLCRWNAGVHLRLHEMDRDIAGSREGTGRSWTEFLVVVVESVMSCSRAEVSE